MEVNIYLFAEQSPRRMRRAAGYILEYVRNGVPETRTNVDFTLCETHSEAILNLAVFAIAKLKVPCDLKIYVETQYLKGIERIEEWRAEGWLTAKKKPRPMQSLWEKLDIELKKHKSYEIIVGENHSYRKWLKEQVERKGKESRNV